MSRGANRANRTRRFRSARRRIRYRDFLLAALFNCRTLSRSWRPTSGAVALRYKTRTSFLYGRQLYVARFLDKTGLEQRSWRSRGARPAGLFEFASRFGGGMRSKSHKLGMPRRVTVFLLTCRGCERSVIIDGNHRMVRLARKLVDVPAEVYELAGMEWAPETPDMNVVCACIN